MKRIQEKVKDIVDVRSYESLQDFISNPAQTLAIYHFTDLTSDLMAKWLDTMAQIEPESGEAAALAGYRGVGKSHFLATLGAIAAQPELRSRITDAHVSASAQQLKRRRYAVAFARRGLFPTLLDEIKAAIAQTFQLNAAELNFSLPDLLKFAVEKSGDAPFVLLIDTAFERTSRVLRDDGVLLGQIAQATENLNIFIGVALDDDIAGADGVNAAISRSYKIDYLDQEHLYRIVNTRIFPKQRQMTPVLHEIYTHFRTVFSDFRWSEQRFSALYPLHPIILETAPFVRLYAPEFSLLGFAAEAGRKILGRPADSLIGLDEVFDKVENNLRKVGELAAAFTVYDKINAQIIAQIPIMQRLQAKMILKALFLLSLDGEGTTAGEIGAAMLISDENDVHNQRRLVADLLETFVAVFPNELLRTDENGREIRYGFKVEGKENLNNALASASAKISPAAIPKVLRRFAREKFSDWTISDENPPNSPNWMESQLIWRGGFRRGRITWNLENSGSALQKEQLGAESLEWELIINSKKERMEPQPDGTKTPTVFWQPDWLRKDETETILRYCALLTQPELHAEYGEQIHAAAHAHSLAVEKIWERIFLIDGTIVIDGFDYNFTEEARAKQNLSEMFAVMLEPLFEMRFPNHPHFAKPLGMNEVAVLVNDLFGGARQNMEEVQRLAETYALPLGLVGWRGSGYSLETEENLLNLPTIKEVLRLVQAHGDETVSLKTIYAQLKKTPNGLVREAQHLLLTALVAQRHIEFVTSKGDRINRRSLDLKIIWDDIEGVAKPIGVVYSSEKLTEWARILTGNRTFGSIENAEYHQIVKESLESWLADWQKSRLLERFNELPDEILNTKIWRVATHAEKTFGSVAETVKAVTDEAISLEEGLHRIADAFSDSEEEFLISTQDLIGMEDFISGAAKREEIWAYLAVCETTHDEKIEYFRDKLLQIVEESYANPSESLNKELENLWETFKNRFAEYFAVKHDTTMKSHHLREKFDEILRSDEWWEFENLAKLPISQNRYAAEAQQIIRQFKQLNCQYNVKEMLETHPFCACGFSLAQMKAWENLPEQLLETIKQGRFAYRRNLLILRGFLAPLIEQIAVQNVNADFSAAVRLQEMWAASDEMEMRVLGNDELILLSRVFDNLPSSPLLEIKVPSAPDYTNRESLRRIFNEWIDELPNEPALLKI